MYGSGGLRAYVPVRMYTSTGIDAGGAQADEHLDRRPASDRERSSSFMTSGPPILANDESLSWRRCYHEKFPRHEHEHERDQAPQDRGRAKSAQRPGRRRRADRRAVDDDDRHRGCARRRPRSASSWPRPDPRWCASPSTCPRPRPRVPEIKQRMLDAGCTAPLIGDFHYNGHLLLTKYPDCARALDKYRINPGNVGTGTAARRAVRDDLQGRGRSRQAGAHRRQRRLAQPGAGRREDAGEHRPRSRQDAPRRSSTSAWCCRRSNRRRWRSRAGCARIRSSSRARRRGRAI